MLGFARTHIIVVGLVRRNEPITDCNGLDRER